MLGWVKHGATIEIAASICGISESRLNDWYRLAQQKPESPLGVLMRDLEQLAKVARNGHSSTGSIVGGGHGRGDALISLVRRDD